MLDTLRALCAAYPDAVAGAALALVALAWCAITARLPDPDPGDDPDGIPRSQW